MCTRQADGRRAEPAGRGSKPRPISAAYETKWGSGTVTVADGALIAVELPGGAAVTTPAAAGPQCAAGAQPAAAASAATYPAASAAAPDAECAVSPADRRALQRWAGELEAYFRGERLNWTPELVDLDALGLGTFERRVYEALMRVPAGATISYGELAEAAGYPRAARAVGNAMAANPIPLVIPCHRVIRADGSMGNYGCDPTWKERLLRHEGTL
jgi:O-6-methylguanine DNA methyltransferase